MQEKQNGYVAQTLRSLGAAVGGAAVRLGIMAEAFSTGGQLTLQAVAIDGQIVSVAKFGGDPETEISVPAAKLDRVVRLTLTFAYGSAKAKVIAQGVSALWKSKTAAGDRGLMVGPVEAEVGLHLCLDEVRIGQDLTVLTGPAADVVVAQVAAAADAVTKARVDRWVDGVAALGAPTAPKTEPVQAPVVPFVKKAPTKPAVDRRATSPSAGALTDFAVMTAAKKEAKIQSAAKTVGWTIGSELDAAPTITITAD